jgi:hypothetical protein
MTSGGSAHLRNAPPENMALGRHAWWRQGGIKRCLRQGSATAYWPYRRNSRSRCRRARQAGTAELVAYLPNSWLAKLPPRAFRGESGMDWAHVAVRFLPPAWLAS